MIYVYIYISDEGVQYNGNRWFPKMLGKKTLISKIPIREYFEYTGKQLEAIQKCQHFHECINSTHFQTPLHHLSIQTNMLGSQNKGLMKHIYYATIKISMSSKFDL